jgi:hypothetical protein
MFPRHEGTAKPCAAEAQRVHGPGAAGERCAPLLAQGDRGMYAEAKTRQNVEAAYEVIRVAHAALAAGQTERAVCCQPLPAMTIL